MLLDSAWTFGTDKLPAPQATLMKMVTEGVMEGNLPWNLVFIGVFLALMIEVIGIPVLPFAIGLYLPIYLSTPIMVGGLIKLIVTKRKNKTEEEIKEDDSKGILYSSGLIAGEGLVGILLAILAVINVAGKIDLSGSFTTGIVGGIVLMVVMILCILKFSLWSKNGKENK